MDTKSSAERITFGLIESAKNHVKNNDPAVLAIDKQDYSMALIEELVGELEKIVQDYLTQCQEVERLKSEEVKVYEWGHQNGRNNALEEAINTVNYSESLIDAIHRLQALKDKS